jgi:hypothetical protein
MESLIRKAILVMAAAVTLHAETVYLSAHGKTFHARQTCMSLSRAKHVYTAERSAAEAHGLRPCNICFRPKSISAKRSAAGNAAWAAQASEVK